MPYDSVSSLPAYVKKLPDVKQRQWMHVFNSCMKDGKGESTCFAMANGVVKKEAVDFELPVDGAGAEFDTGDAVALAEKAYQYVESYDYQSTQLTQAEAKYDPAGGTNEHACSNCQFFISPARCAVVQGEIAPNGVSDWWHAKMPIVQPPIPVIIMGSGADTVAAKSSDLAGLSPREKLQRASMDKRSFAYVDSNGGKHLPIHDAEHVRNALARFNQTHFESDTAKKRAYSKILAAARRYGIDVSKKSAAPSGASSETFAQRALSFLGLRPQPPRDKPAGGVHCSVNDIVSEDAITVVKQADGRLRWFARYSNSWEDRDRELIVEAAHKEFIAWADKTKSYPELWLWHTPGSRFGEADWLDFSDGFAHASGLIDDTPEAEAVVASLAGKEVGVSHGFLSLQTGKYITKYRNFEISVLPLDRAAVWTTDFNVLGKETMMGFTDEKRKFLVDALGEESVLKLEQANKSTEAQLNQLGIEYKSAEQQSEAAAGAGNAASKEALSVLGAQVAELTAVVGTLAQKITTSEAAATTAQKAASEASAAVVAVQRTDDEKLEDAFLAKVAKAFGQNGGAMRPTESGDNVVAVGKEKAAGGAEPSGDFLYAMVDKQIASMFGGAAATAPGAVQAAAAAPVVAVDGQQ